MSFDLAAVTDEDVETIMAWFPDASRTREWGGPSFRFPFDRDTFVEDAHLEGMASFKDRKFYRVIETLWVENGRCILVSAPHERVSRGHGFVAA